MLILRQDLTLLGLGVITAVQKNLQRHSIYRISTDTGTDCWLRLKKRRSQSGTEFQPLRKVLHGFKAAVGPREESSGALQDQDLSKKDEEKAE